MNKNKTVLIVDDSAFMRMILKDLISKHFSTVNVIEAENAKTALDIIKNQTPHLILLDIVMKESENDGLNVLEQISKTHPEIPVMMITSVGNILTRQRCESLGVVAYIQKPFDEKDIVKKINKYL